MQVSKIAFLGKGADAEEARAAGADIVGGLGLDEEIANSKKTVDDHHDKTLCIWWMCFISSNVHESISYFSPNVFDGKN